MKSKRTHEFILAHLNDALMNSRWQKAIGPRNAYKAVELAEADARERAVRAFCKTKSGSKKFLDYYDSDHE